MDALRIICIAHGVFLTREALAAGFDSRSLAAACGRGLIRRVRHGAYVVADIWDTADERQRHRIRARAAYRTSVSEVALSHSSAVLEHTDAWWGLDLETPHITRLDAKSGRRSQAVAPHRGQMVAGDVVEIDGLRVTSPVRSALELTTVASIEASLVSINAMLHAGMFTVRELEERYASGFFRWRDTLTTNIVLRLVDPRIESVGESRTFHLLWTMGVPAPVPQYGIVDERGQLIYRVDFAWPDLGVWLEFDGKGKYLKYLRPGEEPGDAVLREKQREAHIRRLTGWECIRLTWADLTRPAVVLSRFREAIALSKRAS